MENKAVVINAPGDLKVTGNSLSELNADEVLIRIKYVAICGSDIKLYQGTYTAPHKYPIIIGHEWVGEVVQTGEEARKEWQTGDIVTGDCSIYCNSCTYCVRNDKNHCDFIEKKGITYDGGAAQYIIANQQHIYRCPQLPDLKALALVEPLAVSVESVINHIPENDLKAVRNALIIGAGGIGAMAVFMLLEEGIPEITVVDIASKKLSIVDSFGFHNVKTIHWNLADGVIPDVPGYDLIIEAAGSAGALQKAIQMANSSAKIVCIGHQNKLELDFAQVMKKSLTIVANIGSTGGFEKAVNIIEKHYRNIEKLITRIVTLDEVEQYFISGCDTEKDIKVLIDLS